MAPQPSVPQSQGCGVSLRELRLAGGNITGAAVTDLLLYAPHLERLELCAVKVEGEAPQAHQDFVRRKTANPSVELLQSPLYSLLLLSTSLNSLSLSSLRAPYLCHGLRSSSSPVMITHLRVSEVGDIHPNDLRPFINLRHLKIQLCAYLGALSIEALQELQTLEHLANTVQETVDFRTFFDLCKLGETGEGATKTGKKRAQKDHHSHVSPEADARGGRRQNGRPTCRSRGVRPACGPRQPCAHLCAARSSRAG